MGRQKWLDGCEIQAAGQLRKSASGWRAAVLGFKQTAIATADGSGDLKAATDLARACPSAFSQWVAIRGLTTEQRLAQRIEPVHHRMGVDNRLAVVRQAHGGDHIVHRVFEFCSQGRLELARLEE